MKMMYKYAIKLHYKKIVKKQCVLESGIIKKNISLIIFNFF